MRFILMSMLLLTMTACTVISTLNERERKVRPIYQYAGLDLEKLLTGSFTMQVSPSMELGSAESAYQSRFADRFPAFSDSVRYRLDTPRQDRPEYRLNILNTLLPGWQIDLPTFPVTQRDLPLKMIQKLGQLQTDFLIDVRNIALTSDTVHSYHRYYGKSLRMTPTAQGNVIQATNRTLFTPKKYVAYGVHFDLTIWDVHKRRPIMAFHLAHPFDERIADPTMRFQYVMKAVREKPEDVVEYLVHLYLYQQRREKKENL